MNTKNFFSIVLLWTSIIGFNIHCISVPTSYQQTFLLPINGSAPQGKCLNLSVEIPKGFRALSSQVNSTINEFIPQTDKDVYAWSQIITTQVIIGRGISAQYLVSSLKERIAQIPGTQVQVVHESKREYTTYATATVIMAYTNVMQNRREIMLARYYSGPYDCSGFQYTIALSSHVVETDAIRQLKEFADKKSSLVNF